MRKVLIVVLFLIGHVLCAGAERNRWARGATHFGYECRNGAAACVLARVVSPDRTGTLVVRRSSIGSFTYEVVRAGRRSLLQPCSGLSRASEMSWLEMEVLWAPDSAALSLSWNETAITDRTVIFAVGTAGVRQVNLAPLMEQFGRLYPRCVGGLAPCPINQKGKDYNYLTVAWSAPHTAVLMAEVPPSSGWGRNMGKVRAFEVNAISGQIKRVLTPAEFKRRWQSHMGWDFDVSDAE